MSQLKPLIELVDSLVSLALKLRDARKTKAATCSHLLLLAHREAGALEHKNEVFCPCRPTYQCFLCDQIFEPRDGSFYRVTR